MEESLDSMIDSFKKAANAYCKLTEETPPEIVLAVKNYLWEKTWPIERRVMRDRKFPGQES